MHRRQRLPRRRRQPAPARLLRRPQRGRGRAGRGAVGPDPRRVPGRRRLDHRRARRRRRQEEAHAEDVRRAGPGRVPAAALRVRPGRAGQPRQGDADAAAVRRGAGPVPAAPARGRRPGRAVLMADRVRSWPRRSAAHGDGRAGRAAASAAAPSSPGAAGRATRSTSRPARWTGSLEHNVGDFTAVLEAGVRLADAQAAFAERGPDARARPAARRRDGATVGGMIATADSGPLRHRYGGVRDLVVGMTVVLSDGTVAKSGGKVIKNVAGYDLAKLFAGSYGTLGLIASVAVRLHPLPDATATARRRERRPGAARARRGRAGRAAARGRLPRRRLGRRRRTRAGALRRRRRRATRPSAAVGRMRELGLDDARAATDDDEIWAAPARRAALRRRRRAEGLRPPDRPAERARAPPARRRHGRLARRARPVVAGAARRRRRRRGPRTRSRPRPCTVLDGADRWRDAWPAPPDGHAGGDGAA